MHNILSLNKRMITSRNVLVLYLLYNVLIVCRYRLVDNITTLFSIIYTQTHTHGLTILHTLRIALMNCLIAWFILLFILHARNQREKKKWYLKFKITHSAVGILWTIIILQSKYYIRFQITRWKYLYYGMSDVISNDLHKLAWKKNLKNFHYILELLNWYCFSSWAAVSDVRYLIVCLGIGWRWMSF